MLLQVSHESEGGGAEVTLEGAELEVGAVHVPLKVAVVLELAEALKKGILF